MAFLSTHAGTLAIGFQELSKQERQRDKPWKGVLYQHCPFCELPLDTQNSSFPNTSFPEPHGRAVFLVKDLKGVLIFCYCMECLRWVYLLWEVPCWLRSGGVSTRSAGHRALDLVSEWKHGEQLWEWSNNCSSPVLSVLATCGLDPIISQSQRCKVCRLVHASQPPFFVALDVETSL